MPRRPAGTATGTTKALSLLAALAVCGIGLAPGGCALHQRAQNPFPGVFRIAVAPLNDKTGRAEGLDTRRLTELLASELQQVPTFEVVPVRDVRQVLGPQPLPTNQPALAYALGRAVHAQAVLVGDVIEYDPYYPPRLGLHCELYAMVAGQSEAIVATPPDDGAEKADDGTNAAWDRFKHILKDHWQHEFDREQFGKPVEKPEKEGPGFWQGLKKEFHRAEEQGREAWQKREPRRTRKEKSAPHSCRICGSAAARCDCQPTGDPCAGLPTDPCGQPAGPCSQPTDPCGGYPEEAAPPDEAPRHLPPRESQTAWNGGGRYDRAVRLAAHTADDDEREPAPLSGELAPELPDYRVVPVPATPARPIIEPWVVRHSRIFDAGNAGFYRKLKGYHYFREDDRARGVDGYVIRTADFERFACNRMIFEMLSASGGDWTTLRGLKIPEPWQPWPWR